MHGITQTSDKISLFSIITRVIIFLSLWAGVKIPSIHIRPLYGLLDSGRLHPPTLGGRAYRQKRKTCQSGRYKSKRIRWKQGLNLRGETPSDDEKFKSLALTTRPSQHELSAPAAHLHARAFISLLNEGKNWLSGMGFGIFDSLTIYYGTRNSYGVPSEYKKVKKTSISRRRVRVDVNWKTEMHIHNILIDSGRDLVLVFYSSWLKAS